MTRFLILTLFLLFLIPCAAQDQLELNAKAKANFEAADKDMRSVYEAVKPQLDARTQPLFAKSQQDWERYRDAEEELWGTYGMGGMAVEVLLYGKLTELTETRASYLRQWMEHFSF